MTAGPLLEITLLGGFQVAVGGVAVPDRAWRQRRAAAVVKLLALAPSHYLHREQIIDTLWPDLDLEPAANNLRVALHHARRQLTDAAGDDASAFLERDGDGLRLGPADRVRVDLDLFEAAAARAWRGEDFSRAEAALRLYRGELLLEDPYEDWAADRRTAAQTTFVTLLARQAEWHEAHGRLDQAIVARRRQVATEPLDELAQTALIRLLAVADQPHQALEQFDRLTGLLDRELGVEPEPATQALAAAIREGRFPEAKPPPVPTATPDQVPAAPALQIARRLPAPVDELVGRDQELAELRHLLRSRRLLSLTGPGGVGKTRLAIAVARAAAAEFAAGAAFVDLAPLVDSRLVLPEIARALGVPEVGGASLLDTLADVIGEARLLLVIDNVEHVLPAVPVLTELLGACSGLSILLTSRTRPRLQGEQEYPVAPLPLPDPPDGLDQAALHPGALGHVASVALFVRRAKLARPDFELTAANADALAEISRRLDGLPLAIEMAAARVRLMPPAELARRLAHPLAVLGGGVRDAPARQRTLRATLVWSYDLLTPEEQTLFAVLAVFAGGMTLDAVEAVADGIAGLDSSIVLETAAALVDHSLVGQHEDDLGRARLGMLETIREFAHEQLAAGGEAEAVRWRHAAHFLALAEAAAPALTGPEQADWLDRLELEIDNLRAALRAFDHPDHSSSLVRLAAALWRFWWIRGYLTEGRDWLERAIAAAADTPDPSSAMALDGAGVLAEAQGDLATATQRHQVALTLWQALGDRQGQLRTLLNLGLVASERGEPRQAIRLYEEALAIARAIDDRAGIAGSLANLGQAAIEQGAFGPAAAYFRESLHLFRALGDQRNLGAILDNLGSLAFREGDYQRAAAFQAEALDLLRALGDRQGMADTLANYGHATQRLGDLAQAERLYADALALYQQVGDQSGVAFVLRHQGRLAFEQGDPGRAEALLRQSFHLAWTLGEQIALTEAMEALAAVVLDRGEAAPAARLLGAAGAVRKAAAVPVPAVHAAEHRRCVETARALLGEEAFAAALDEGRALRPEQSLLALAIGE